MNLKKWFGIIFIFAGLFISFTDRLITGYAIASDIQDSFPYFNFLGILVFFLGVLMLLSFKEELEKRVTVYDRYEGKGMAEAGERYEITDPELYLSQAGFLSLEEFRREFDKIKNDSELATIVRGSYAPELLRLLKRGGEKAEIAKRFLQILYPGEILIGAKTKRALSSEEREKIINAFKGGWRIAPNAHQREILSEYGLGYQVRQGSGHGEIYLMDNHNFRITTSISPSDLNAGRALGRDIIHMLDRIREETN